MHARAHDETLLERRGDTLTARGLRVVSHALRVTGVCDVVEFHLDSGGISLPGQDGCWQPYPVEYKRGAPKSHDADELQLCGQAMCLEEMLLCEIPEGSLYYGETRRRQVVAFTPELRGRVRPYAGSHAGRYGAGAHALRQGGQALRRLFHEGNLSARPAQIAAGSCLSAAAAEEGAE